MSSLYLKYGEMNADIGEIRWEDIPRLGGGHATKERSADDRYGVDMLKVMNDVEGKSRYVLTITHQWRQTI